MSRVAYWSHFALESRSAATQRMRAFIAQLESSGCSVLLIGGGFQSDTSVWRYTREAWRTLSARVAFQIISLPPYRSAILQGILITFLRRRLIIDQRDLALATAPPLDQWLERRFIRRANALVVTTHAQRREMNRRYGTLPRTCLIRNGASADIASLPRKPRDDSGHRTRLRVLYQGLVGGKKLKEIAKHLAALNCDVDLALFVDFWSEAEVEAIKTVWTGKGVLTIYPNCDAPTLARLMDDADVALNPVPDNMDYAFTVKTADYVVRGLPQLVIGSRRSVSRRVVELCRLGHAIDTDVSLDEESLRRAIARFRPRSAEGLRVFLRETYAPRITQILGEIDA